MPNYANPIGKGKPPGALKKKYTGNPYSAGASTMKKKKPKKRKTPLYGRSARPKSAKPARSRGV